jgi:phosphopentomutase
MSPFVTRAIVIVLDSVGIGELPDAAAYGDSGSHTLGNVCRRVMPQLPVLASLGLSAITPLRGLDGACAPQGAFGRMAEASPGKDSVTGHWELMGLVLDRPFPVFPNGFPPDLIARFEQQVGRPILGNVVASGTVIVQRLGPEHLRTARPIVYTSADSVFQIAAHEDVVPLEELYRWCRAAYTVACEGFGVGRVIARPFVGEPGRFTRTSNRRDFARPPSGVTLLDRLASAAIPVLGIGKIEDLFAGRGIARSVHTASDDEGMDEVERAMDQVEAGLILANLVDFDTLYGHRNDVAGYGANLERFDCRLGAILPRLHERDLLVVTADHGNDPTTPSTDHSREYVPLLLYGPRVRPGISLGTRETFADLGQTLAEALGVPGLEAGRSFLAAIWDRPGGAVDARPRTA